MLGALGGIPSRVRTRWLGADETVVEEALSLSDGGLRPRLGNLLLRQGLVTPDELAGALLDRERSGRRLGEILVENGFISSRELAWLLAEQLGFEFLDLAETDVDPVVAGLLPENLAVRYGALPVRVLDDDTVLVAVADPTNVITSDDLHMVLGRNVRLAVVDEVEISRRISRFYRIDAHVEPDEEDIAPADTEPSAAVTVVNDLIASAVGAGASDLHFEPEARGLIVRVRIDGLMRHLTRIPRNAQQGITTRLKVMGELDIAERRLPQDGRASVRVGLQKLDLRMAVMPVPHGEKVVLRIHHRAGARLTLDQLGMGPGMQVDFTRAIRQPFGTIIVCGPTGSGKTTTLYAALDLLNDESQVLATIEDPVERQLPGVSQVEVSPRSGLTFARGLRTMLRADPDVLLVGEMRDEETAQIAMQASLTGHLVLTTVHTHSAPGAVVRLRHMGIDPDLIAATVNCIVAQRLVRRLCSHCAYQEPATPDERAQLDADHADDVIVSRPRGCPACDHTGYKGRVALYELMPITSAIRRSLESTTEELFAAAVNDGMTTLRQDGHRLCRDGISTIDEIDRVTGDRRF